MKTILCSILILNLVACKGEVMPDSTGRKYEKSLRYVLNNLDKVNDEEIEFSIPTTTEESLIYFSSDYKKELSKEFQSLQNRIVDLCVRGNTGVLKKYFYLSEFVDGYFGEDYFDSINKIMKAQKDLACSTLLSSDVNKTKRLTEIKSEYCQ